MELILTFIPDHVGGLRVAFLLPDARTSWGPKLRVRTDSFPAMVGRLGGDADEAAQQLRSWGQGSLHLWPNRDQVAWLMSHAGTNSR